MKSIKINNLLLLPSFCIFIIFCLFFFYFSKGNTYLFTSDFSFYHDYANSLLGDFASDLSDQIYMNNDNQEWNPSPFYSLIFLSPITLLGSKELFFLEGLIMGLLIIYNFLIAIYKLNISIDKRTVSLILLLITLFPSFLIETITVSTNSVFLLFGLLSFNSKSPFSRIFCLIICSLIRANYLLFIISIICSNLIFKPEGFKKFILLTIPSIATYIITYKLTFSSYPGSEFNYLLLAEGQNLSILHNYSQNIFSDLLISENINSIIFWDANILEILKLIFSSQENLAYFINLWITKISLTLGYLHDGLTTTNSGLWFLKAWRTIYFSIISLPAFYIASLELFLNRFSSIEKTVILSGIFMVILNSALIGLPKYFIGIHAIFIYVLILFLSNLSSFQLNIEKKIK